MKHVVHCSGYSLAEIAPNAVDKTGAPVVGRFFDWKHVCIGNPGGGLLGRIPMAIHIWAAINAELVIWSTGSSYLNDVPEAEFMRERAIEYAHEQLGEQMAGKLRTASYLDLESTNTVTSMIEAAKIVADAYKTESVMVHLITSRNHAPRVLRDAATAFPVQMRVILSSVPCHTSYGYKDVRDIRIHELGDP